VVDDHAAGRADSGSEQPRQPGVDAGEAFLGVGVGGGVAGGAAEDRRGGGQGGAPPPLAHLTAERREIGLRPLARARERQSGGLPYAACAITPPTFWRDAPSASKDLTSKSTDTEASAASILATRD